MFRVKQDQMSNRYDSILQWLQTENSLMTLTDSHTQNLEMLSHLKTVGVKAIQHKGCGSKSQDRVAEAR